MASGANWLDAVVATAHDALRGLPVEHPVQQYLRLRGVTPPDIETHRLGYLADGLVLTHVSTEFWGWAKRFAFNALIFPFTDPLGTVIGMQARGGSGAMQGTKAENFVFKPRELFLPCFGLAQSLPAMFDSERVVIVEGVFDYFAARRVATDVFCPLTASVSLGHKRLLARYVSLAICLFDMDKTGRRGAYKLAGLEIPQEYRLPEDITGRTPTPPPFQVLIPSYSEHDPNDLFRAGKLDELARLVVPLPMVRR